MSQLRKQLDSSRPLPPHVVLLAGATAGVCEIASTYPLDTIKLQMQVSTARNASMVSSAMHILRTTGIPGMYAGLPASLAQVGGKVALRFTAYDQIRGQLRRHGRASHWTDLIAGCSAGAVEAVVWTTPTERIKILQQNDAGRSVEALQSSSTWGRLVTLVRTQGMRSLYVGTVATVWKQSASVGTRFWMYASTRDWLCAGQAGPPRVWQTLATGAMVGGASTVLNHPFDVIKSRMQAGQTRYSGTFSGLSTIFREEGFAAVMKGLSPRFTRVAFAQAITFSVYEACLSLYCREPGRCTPEAAHQGSPRRTAASWS